MGECPGIETALEARGLGVRAGRRPILRRVGLAVPRHRVLALVGPSGAGKSTLLACFNRLVDLAPGLAVEGQVLLGGEPIYRSPSERPQVDPDRLRARVGTLFQQPVIFPGSIYANVVFGLRHARALPRRRWRERAERVLAEAALWREVRDRLDEPADRLSVGQQQRLCLARALALEPEVVLMDEPTGSLDPASTRAVEELIGRLAERRTVVLVTHDLAQARRVAHWTGVVLRRSRDGEPEAGELVECAPTEDLFTAPGDAEVAEYLASGLPSAPVELPGPDARNPPPAPPFTKGGEPPPTRGVADGPGRGVPPLMKGGIEGGFSAVPSKMETSR